MRILGIFLILCAISASVGGCSKREAVTSIDRSRVLPETVARNIVEKYLGKTWADAPYITRIDPGIWCPSNNKNKSYQSKINYSDIKTIGFTPCRGVVINSTVVGGSVWTGYLVELQRTDLDELVLGLNALGANITSY